MLRTSVNSNFGNRNSFQSTLALWTPRSYQQNGGAMVTNGNNGKAAFGAKHQQHPFVTDRFHHKCKFNITSDPGQTQQVDVLNKLPNIYSSRTIAASQLSHHQDSSLQLPLLVTNKRERFQQLYNPHQVLLLQQHQPMPSTQEAQLIEAVEAAYEAVEDRLRDLNSNSNSANNAANGKSRFRISVRDRANLKQQQQQQQRRRRQKQQQPEEQSQQLPSPQLEQQGVVPIAYFSRSSGSWRSARVDDPDARSCDLRNPNQTVAYSRALDYIQDNELMPATKSQSIWRWIDDLDDNGARTFFVYDEIAKWFAADEKEV